MWTGRGRLLVSMPKTNPRTFSMYCVLLACCCMWVPESAPGSSAHSKNGYVMQNASLGFFVEVSQKFVILTEKFVILM